MNLVALPRKIKKRITRLFGPSITFDVHPLTDLEKMGTEYGGWVIPSHFLDEESVCYLAGAGEDISFDVDIAEKYRSQVHIFDPTPRAIVHFNGLVDHVIRGAAMPVNNQENEFYTLQKENLANLHFHDLGIWNEATILKFYEPANKEHVSHSAVNLQKTTHYFKAKVDRLSAIMRRLRHSAIDVLKLDVEGAEYNVIDSLIADRLDIKVICIEFDEVYNQLDANYATRINQAIQSLENAGYWVTFADDAYNCTFVRQDVYHRLA